MSEGEEGEEGCTAKRKWEGEDTAETDDDDEHFSCKTRLEQPTTIRGRFGATDTQNATHGSDSVETASREVAFFFPDFSIAQWAEEEEPLSGRGKMMKIKFIQRLLLLLLLLFILVGQSVKVARQKKRNVFRDTVGDAADNLKAVRGHLRQRVALVGEVVGAAPGWTEEAGVDKAAGQAVALDHLKKVRHNKLNLVEAAVDGGVVTGQLNLPQINVHGVDEGSAGHQRKLNGVAAGAAESRPE
ncbi:Nucleoside diphosphate kinase 6 [Tyrophagus putrescentiae]|nr:Nucleoside diphosphate kinase 6 [Tyrophagus putrescentiae]